MFEMIEDNEIPDLQAIANEVNASGKNWKANPNSHFNDMTRSDMQKTLGTIVDPDWLVKTGGIRDYVGATIPTEFNSNTQWPECESVINNIRDQSDCGSCWAFGSTEALNDRICVHSNGAFTEYLSTSDTTGCCNGTECFSFGCGGGQPGLAWGWFTRTGVVTGSGFGDG
jgi:cathepsin B